VRSSFQLICFLWLMLPLTLTLSLRERGQPSAVIGWRLIARPMQTQVFSAMANDAPSPGGEDQGEGHPKLPAGSVSFSVVRR